MSESKYREFEEWLEERGCLAEYQYNLIEYPQTHSSRVEFPSCYVTQAFQWIDTAEGFYYWACVHEGWMYKLEVIDGIWMG